MIPFGSSPLAPPPLMSPPRRGRDGGRILRPPVLELSPSPEPPSPELIPKDAVPYQYEACPLCNKVKGNFSTAERFTAKYTGVAIMLMVSKKLKKHITSPALHEAAQTWTTALDGRVFVMFASGGSKTNLANLAVFGVLRPILP
ncbi:uncharacterized protein LOC135611039 isoform X1 [Musa acuminata AAA Group]|uniref:uncharacterized protein LOC135611039 isoform X1 n=1 Tax=Musa acuminata AAA Group TaxID=214697 RepID=UPI0031D1FB29